MVRRPATSSPGTRSRSKSGKARHAGGRPTASPADSLVSPQLNLWRAPTDNDGFKLMPDLTQRLRVADTLCASGGGRPRSSPRPRNSSDTGSWPNASSTARPTDTRSTSPSRSPTCPASASASRSRPGSPELRWYGARAPRELPDRNRSAMMGVWSAEPDESPYLVPQEFGLRTDCRCSRSSTRRTARQCGSTPSRRRPLHFSATHHTPADLYEAATQSELRRRDGLVVCVDAAHRGLGTASCGPDVLPQYRLAAGAPRVRLPGEREDGLQRRLCLTKGPRPSRQSRAPVDAARCDLGGQS